MNEYDTIEGLVRAKPEFAFRWVHIRRYPMFESMRTASFSCLASGALAMILAGPAPAVRAQDRPAPEKAPAEAAEAALKRAQEIAESTLKALKEEAEKAQKELGRDGGEARERLERQLREKMDQVRGEAQRAAREAREQLEQALEKAKESAPEKEQAIRRQLRELEAKMQEFLGRPTGDGPGGRDRPASPDRMREMEARLQDEIADLERRLEDRRTRLRDVQKAMRDTEGRRGERGEETERPGRRVPPPANIGPEIEERFRKLEGMLDRLMKRLEGEAPRREPAR